MNLAITSKITNNNTSFGLRTDKATQDLVLNSNISETAKILFKNMLLDRSTDRFSLTIKQTEDGHPYKFLAGLCDKKHLLNNGPKNHIYLDRSNSLEKLIKTIFYPKKFDSYGKYFEHISEDIIQPMSKKPYKEKVQLNLF